MYTDNIILMADSYKSSHFRQNPPGTEYVYSYIESRGGKYDRTLFFGLQMFLKRYLTEPVTSADVDEADAFYKAHGVPFNREGWDHIVRAHGGKLPLYIRAVPEGLVVPTGNVLVTVVNTDPQVPWLTSFMETAILRAVWYPTTVATQSWHIKQTIRRYLEETSDDPEGQLPFKLHDFGARGASSSETAAIGGAAHLVNFQGSDTVEGIIAANRFYRAGMAGFSIPAAEHSTITSWGREGETEAYRNMLTQFAKPGSILAVVSDSYDLRNAVDNIWGGTLKQAVIDSGATVVIRPDSGHPVQTPVDTVIGLGEKFGTTKNSKGFKVINHNVRVIQGDGINAETVDDILEMLQWFRYSADNIAFGMGGALLQGVNRDTQRMAMKCSAIRVNGEWRDVYKDPITDPGKRSKRGQLALIRENGRYETVAADESNFWQDVLEPVYANGNATREYTFKEVRDRANRPALD
jgi:nicotinamide phosphoribosyltransferase